MPEWCHFVCRVMILLLPASLAAQDPSRGLLHSEGGTWLNEAPAPNVAAIFPDSLVQTSAGHAARIEVDGSSILIQPESMVQFQGHELVLDHGWLQLDTAREVEVMAGCLTISPVSADRTQYDVSDASGKVNISATKGDVKIHSHAGPSRKGSSADSVVHQGEHVTRVEQCGFNSRTNVPGAGTPGLLDTTQAEFAGVVAAGVLICLGLCHGDDPISPARP